MKEKSYTHTIWSSKTIVFLIHGALIVSLIYMGVCIFSPGTYENISEEIEATYMQNNIQNNNQATIMLTEYHTWGNDGAGIAVYIDPETGVNYLILREFERAGICPRYNADGTLYISEVAV